MRGLDEAFMTTKKGELERTLSFINSESERLSKLLRSSTFPASVASVESRSVTHEMLSESEEVWASGHKPDKTNFKKSDELTHFFEAEFFRRNLVKAQKSNLAK
jgi:hypothetical protein